jgi:DNA-binding transcriptional LysR family regulator
MRRYTLRQLDTFLEVARQLSITRAAAALHISQPAVSMQLRQLEDIVGMPLYEQIGRKIRLTDAGHEVAQYTMAATAQLRQLEDAMAARRGIREIFRADAAGAVSQKIPGHRGQPSNSQSRKHHGLIDA